MTKKIIQANALAVLAEVMKKRNWQNGKIPREIAWDRKNKLKNNKLSYKIAFETLQTLGWEKVVEETWQAPDLNTK